MPFSEDLSEFFATDFNGEDVTVTGIGTVRGMFDAEFAASQEIEGGAPVFICREADVSSAEHGTTLVRSGTTYAVVGMQPDGTGLVALILEAQ